MKWNYWVRRPRNSMMPDVSDELRDQRVGRFNDVAQSFKAQVDALEHAVIVATTMDELEDALAATNVDAYDIVADESQFEDAVRAGDVEGAKRQLRVGIKGWARETTRAEPDGDNDVHGMLKAFPDQ